VGTVKQADADWEHGSATSSAALEGTRTVASKTSAPKLAAAACCRERAPRVPGGEGVLAGLLRPLRGCAIELALANIDAGPGLEQLFDDLEVTDVGGEVPPNRAGCGVCLSASQTASRTDSRRVGPSTSKPSWSAQGSHEALLERHPDLAPVANLPVLATLRWVRAP
jgi:hypothetical protein